MNLEIEIKTPTVITSGETIFNIELIKKDNSLFRIEKGILFNSILKDENMRELFLDKFKKILSQEHSKITDLYKDIKIKENFLIKPEIVEYPKEIIEYRQQILDYIGYISKINDEIYYLPYIPGSSIKGAIRNSIVSKFFEFTSQNISYKDDFYFSKLDKLDKNELVLYKEDLKKIISQLRDVFRFIQITDFSLDEKINNFKMGIGLVKRISRSNMEGKIPIYTYYLIPGTKFKGEINISIDLKNYIKNYERNLNKNIIIQEMILNNYKNGEVNKEGIINYILKSVNEYTNKVANNNNIKFLFENYNVKLSNGANDIYDAFIGRFKGKYLNLPKPNYNVNTYPILFTGNNMKYKMGHIQLKKR